MPVSAFIQARRNKQHQDGEYLSLQPVDLPKRKFNIAKVAGSAQFKDQPVELFMTRHPEAVTMMDPLAFALGKMSAGGYRHLPVVADGEPKGIVSVRDLLRHIMRLCRE